MNQGWGRVYSGPQRISEKPAEDASNDVNVPNGAVSSNVSAAADYRQQARIFLARAREYLVDDDLHQAAEKAGAPQPGWLRPVAEVQGWQYRKHDEFFTVMYQAEELSRDNRLPNLWHVANTLHGFFYTRKMFLRSDAIGQGLDQIETVLDILEPLAGVESTAKGQ